MSKTNTRTVWTQQDYEFLKQNYLNMSNKELGENLGKTRSAVQNKLKVIGLVRPDKYCYNKTFFKNIDNEEKSYWLGFFYADGYICRTNSGCEASIELKASDIEHLRKLNKSLEGNVCPAIRERVCHYDNTRIDRIASIRFYSNEMVSELENQGCVLNKTDKIKLPCLKQELLWHFIRGFFDGDGCVTLNKLRNAMQFDFCSSSLTFLEELKTFLYKNGIFSYISQSAQSSGPIKRTIPNYRLVISGMENGYCFAEKIYQRATIYLDRKRTKYLDLLEQTDTVNRIKNHNGPRHKIK